MSLLSFLTLGRNSLLFETVLPILKQIAIQEAPVLETKLHTFLAREFPNVAANGSPAQLTAIVGHASSLLGAVKDYLHGTPETITQTPVQ